MTQGRADLAAVYDAAPVGARYWRMFAVLAANQALDFFDFFIVNYLVVVITPQWHLTYGQTAAILLGAGLGAMVGALAWGLIADRHGRRPLIVAGTLICAAASVAVALVPDGDWLTMAVLRFGVGFGLAASATPTGALIVEHTPTRLRTFAGSFIVVANSVGILCAGATAAVLLGALGWRGVALLGVLPAAVGVMVWRWVPESYLWLVAAGRPEAARAAVAATLNVDPETLPLPAAPAARERPTGLAALFADPRRVVLVALVWLCASIAFYGVYQWGPTIFAQVLAVTPQQAARLFVLVGIAGVGGKVLFSVLPQRIGRRRSGELMGYGAALGLALTGLSPGVTVAGLPAFVVLVMAAAVCFEGGLANIAPYSVEVYGVRLGARAVGLQQAANAVGKIVGPVVLAVIAGSGDVVTPKATAAAVLPAFLFFAACSAAVGIIFTVAGIETHGKTLAMPGDTAAVGSPAA